MKSGLRGKCGNANIARDRLAEIPDPFLSGEGSKVGFAGAGGKKKSVEERYVYICADGSVPG